MFSVTNNGETTPRPDPNADDRHKAALLAEGGNFDADSYDLFARGIAIARNGGDVRAFLRQEVAKSKGKAGTDCHHTEHAERSTGLYGRDPQDPNRWEQCK